MGNAEGVGGYEARRLFQFKNNLHIWSGTKNRGASPEVFKICSLVFLLGKT